LRLLLDFRCHLAQSFQGIRLETPRRGQQGGLSPLRRRISVSILKQLKMSIGDKFTELEYLFLGLVSAIPSFVTPLLFVGKADKGKHQFDAAV
ncbi:hypothetical protein Taro_018173, partial [Colocasia esculenta]|nr:hypothetical protein [Colocasia esculenta]